MSACDRLEQGVKDGDQESIKAVRDMINHWTENGTMDGADGMLARAFMLLMRRCSEGKDEDIAVAMMAIRCITEGELQRAFGKDEPQED